MAYRYEQCHCLAAIPATMSVFSNHMQAGTDPGGTIAPTKTYESNFIHHDFVQFGN